jgi:condensin complex subunit 1
MRKVSLVIRHSYLSYHHTLAKGTSASSPAPSKDGEELDQVVGNTEDEIGDLIASVREDEMMFSPDSLLANFGPMIAHICLNPAMFKVN